MLPGLLPPYLDETRSPTRADAFEPAARRASMARAIAELSPLSLPPTSCSWPSAPSAPVVEAATAFFGVLDIFGLGRIIEAGERASCSPTASTAWRSTGRWPT